MNMKKFSTFLSVLLLSVSLNAQNFDNFSLPSSLRNSVNRSARSSSYTSTQSKDLFVGGILSYNFSRSLSLTPYFGIYATDWLRVGAGPCYELTLDLATGMPNHSFGATAFAEAVVAKYLVFHVGYEYLSYPLWSDPAVGPIEKIGRDNVHALALGLGFQTRLSNMVSLNVMYMLYPVESENTYYHHQFLEMFVRAGVQVDLFAKK